MKTLVWFRNDLRLLDNPALFRAVDDSKAVHAVYVHCEEYVERHSLAPVRQDFVRQHLLLLAQHLAESGVVLSMISVALAADIPAALLEVARVQRCDALHFNAEYPLDEFNRDKAVAALLKSEGIIVRRFHERALIPPGMIRNGQGQPYKVFTAFRRTWLQQASAVSLQPLPKPSFASVVPVVADFEAIEALFANVVHEVEDLPEAGEAAAHDVLLEFIETGIEHYHETRDFPAVAGTSLLSPYLSIGAISVRHCLAAALARNGGEWDTGSEGVSTWITELIWRDFYQHVVTDFPAVCRHKPMQAHTDQFPWRRDPGNFEAWCQGKTGIPIVDAAMRQLLQTGWMHNRLRMVVAMFLTKNLQIDWRLGESWFMSRLLDGEFAANNGGWQWSASTGTDAAPYFRVFNPVSQSRKFDPEGEFIRRFVPELAHLSHKAIHEPPATAGYPAPIVDLGTSRKHTIALFAQLGKSTAQDV